ncbi:MAG: (2Fe-2S)-binding protein [Alphaproteobacteria bacterium]
MAELVSVSLVVNGRSVSAEVDPRTLLVVFLRETLHLTGTHVGCDTSQCGACLVEVNGRTVKSCTLLLVQADGASVTTIEGLAPAENEPLPPMQAAFHHHHALQCGFCTPGMVLSGLELVRRVGMPTEAQIRKGLEGNLCRCTGYQNIVRAVQAGAAAIMGRGGTE